ncbi:citrate lyase holo-[acyl-carrier protein] synthase [Paramaledivibacter caminithermalis]|jgi:holo-ACP synthase|uniref:citrate lyase holo-[acyl-carrier protein] synthase n=1 Tax=Paramaledivibacter caminithermalis (strain DSM 15212 / CIP 107654 / DViRD3) TaxID=1121301 RepID=A0A1M6PCJ4_PARC5|nr:citrate lyase holo-[acyl-carrier protein] synthase [Paramaledivibacter caminithermalis]SHK05668.1 holo-ACP synthase [Paramaledivibacter caminithermalis DSM 15212]
MNTNENINIILLNRERRTIYQKKLVKEYKKTLITFKLNIPGPQKDSQLFRRIFNNGLTQLKNVLKKDSINIVFERAIFRDTGPEAFIIVDAQAEKIKILCIEIEEKDGLGRIYDFDVFDSSGKNIGREIVGKNQRKCFLCDEYVWVCSRNRTHSVEEMLQYIHNTAQIYFKNKKLREEFKCH